MAYDREDLIYMAKLAEQAERYDEMVDFMKKLAGINGELNVEERNLLSVAYKNLIGSRRAAWRMLNSEEQRENSVKAKEYRLRVEEEIFRLQRSLLSLLENRLIPDAKAGEPKVFFLKMKGDYNRYMAEFSSGEQRKEAAENALLAYKLAFDDANALEPTNPVRLGLALNFSVFYYEILNSPDRACKLAKTAFDAAIAELDSLNEDSYKDATMIMQLLRDNLTLWTIDASQDGDKDDAKVQDLEGDN